MKSAIVLLFIACLACSCSVVKIKYGPVEITSKRLFEDQNLEGLSVTAPDGTVVKIDKKSSAVQTQLLSDTLSAIVKSVVMP